MKASPIYSLKEEYVAYTLQSVVSYSVIEDKMVYMRQCRLSIKAFMLLMWLFVQLFSNSVLIMRMIHFAKMNGKVP